MEDEVTRVEAVRYLQGASGHGVFSLLFLLAAWVAFLVDAPVAGWVCLLVAYGVALNGISIYAWDRLRTYFVERLERRSTRPRRALAPRPVSPEMGATMLVGFLTVAAFLIFVLLVFGVVRTLRPPVAAALAGIALATANVIAIWWAIRSPPAG